MPDREKVTNETFYRDHWIDVEPERFRRYTEMFAWSEASRPLLEPAGIGPGEVVVDLGCGPGFTAMEMASWVGGSGHVHGVEINRQFVEFARSVAVARGLEDVVSFHHVDGPALPFADRSIDCIVAKNILVYVESLNDTFEEGYRVLRDGGRFHAVEGDWGLALAEPVPAERWKALIDAAGIAFRHPTAGRRLYGVARGAGFRHVEVLVMCRPDTTGRLLPMVQNICGYARESGLVERSEIDAILRICERASAEGTLLILNPQFVVTATR